MTLAYQTRIFQMKITYTTVRSRRRSDLLSSNDVYHTHEEIQPAFRDELRMQRDWLAARDNCIPYNCEPPREKRMVVLQTHRNRHGTSSVEEKQLEADFYYYCRNVSLCERISGRTIIQPNRTRLLHLMGSINEIFFKIPSISTTHRRIRIGNS